MNIFRHLPLRYRFSILLGVFAIGFAIYGGWSFKSLNEIKVNGPVYQRIVQGKDLIADILPPPEYIIESYLVSLEMLNASDQTKLNEQVARLRKLKADYDDRHAFWLKEDLDKKLTEVFLTGAHQPAVAFYAAAFDEFIPALQKQDREAAVAVASRMRASYEIHRKAIDEVVQLAVKRVANDEAMAKERIASATWWLLTILATSLVISMVVAAVIVRGLLADLGGEPYYAVQITRRIAAGDLTMDISVKQTDRESLLYSVKSMQEVLAKTAFDIQTVAESVRIGSQQIASGNLDLSSRTEKQASSLEETAASMEELHGTFKNNAEHALHARALANEASAVAVQGGESVSKVAETMESIHAAADKIVNIISVIDGIAFQTNILALNAAVEAARAGEQGRGFAVVASEVRGLAQRSATAAKEIKMLIGDSVSQVNIGTQLVEQAATTMNTVVSSIHRVNDIIDNIASAIVEQQSGIEQVHQAVSQMDQVTQQNATLVEEAASAAQSLQDQANSLKEATARFKTSRAIRPSAETETAMLRIT